MHVRVEDLQVLAAVRQEQIVGEVFVVGQEVILNDVTLVPQAQDQLVVPEVGVVLHNVPQDRSAAHVNHGLRDAFVGLSDPHTKATAEQYNLHSNPPSGPTAFTILSYPHKDQ